jgi:hypothetical protein
MSGTSVLAELLAGPVQRVPGFPPATDEMPAILAAARHRAGPPLKIRRYESEDGTSYWRWDCTNCGEYGGGRHHPDAVTRAMRHCFEHPAHGSSLLPPARCRERDNRLAVHPMLFAVDDDPPPPPLAV